MVVLCPVGDVKILSLISTFLLKTLTLIELKRIFFIVKETGTVKQWTLNYNES